MSFMQQLGRQLTCNPFCALQILGSWNSFQLKIKSLTDLPLLSDDLQSRNKTVLHRIPSKIT